jgi:broad specificity phosphatase PhoE
MLRLHFVRHGESAANAEAWLAGHGDAPLTERGLAQAIALREVLRGHSFDRVVSSDLSRARRTAEAIIEGRGLTLITHPVLRERSCGAWERRGVLELEACGDLDLLQQFDGRPPGGESLRDVAKRVLAGLPALLGEGDNLIVAHGAMMRATIGVLDRLPLDRICEWKPNNCEVATRELSLEDLAAALRTI